VIPPYILKGPSVTISENDIARRTLLHRASGLILAAASTSSSGKAAETTEAPKGVITGKGIGDFDFLTGEWTIKNKRLKDGTKDVWQEFAGAATVHRVMGGMASIEELRFPASKYAGMGVRVWHSEEMLWADHWTGSYNGVVNAPMMGQFIDGDGIFIADDEIDGKPVKSRGVWDRITPRSCRWHQSSSTDGGKTWDYNWYMDWKRVR
jgi:hypothetical protein